MTVLRLSGITKRFGAAPAVRDVDLSVAAASRTAIVGPSGCGKTTLLRLIAGFEVPDAGRITLGDRVLADGPAAVPAHRRGIGLVAQDGALFPHLSIAENIGFGLPGPTPDRDREIARLADFTGLARVFLGRHPHELSGGQQQRVAVARALARQPVLMLLDEPFSSLDTGLRVAMCSAVVDLLAEARIASILVTHDQGEALAWGDQIAVMQDGALTQTGAPLDLYLRPRTRRTAEFLGEALILPATVAGGIATCALGAVRLDRPEGAPEGWPEGPFEGRHEIMLRPEQIRLLPAASVAAGAAAGAMPERSGKGLEQATGIVTAVDFRGPTGIVTVRVGDRASGDGAPGDRASGDRADGSGMHADGTGPATLRLRQPSVALPRPGDAVRFEVTGTAHILGTG